MFDFANKNEAKLCSPRAFIGESFSNFCWRGADKNEWGAILCKQHRDGYTMAKIFTDVGQVDRWIVGYHGK